MDANQQQAESTKGFRHTLDTFMERLRSGELRARLHYFLFRQTQHARQSDSLLAKYLRRLREDWTKWAGIGAGISGLLMLFSPERFWFWQIPLGILSIFIAPVLLELPAALNSLFGNTEHQHLVGQMITLTQPIVDGRGGAVIDGRQWQISGPDCEMGREVKIVTLDAKTLYVTPIAPNTRELK